MSPRWYLRHRITVAFTLTTLVLTLCLALFFGQVVYRTIQGEIDALAREELEETKAFLFQRVPTLSEVETIAREVGEAHPMNRFAWRLWLASDGFVAEVGPPDLLALMPSTPSVPRLARPASGRRLIVGEAGLGGQVAIALDADFQAARFARFCWMALVFVLAATGIASLAGWILARRVSVLIEGVARVAGTAVPVEEWPSSQGAPEEIRAVITTLQDTLRRIRAEDEQARLLASGLAHELRSPLQNLIGETQVALLRERDASEYRQVLESHLEDLCDLSRVVDNLVTLASIDEARRRMAAERFDLVAEARLRLKREDKLAERRGVGLKFLAEGSCEVEGDRESLLLALRNLVTNAIEWTPRGGGVELRIRPLGDGLEILVDDAGPGVPESERATLFQPFHRGRTAEGRRVGFGLGLALTHSAVAAQGGTIEVEDSPLGGARFRVRLPLRNSA